jgi:hypothetical protein
MEGRSPAMQGGCEYTSKHARTNDKEWYSNLGDGHGANTLHHKVSICYERHTRALDLDGFFA